MSWEIIRPGTHYDFVGKAKVCVLLSGALIAASVAALAVNGMRMGIDFAGGTEIQIRFTEGTETSEGPIREVVSANGVEDPSVVRYGELQGEQEFLIRFAGDPGDKGEQIDILTTALGEKIGPLAVDRVEFVGPRVGAELRRNGLKALGIAILLVLIYIAFRFSARFAPGAIVAMLHDLLITGGIFVLFGLEFDLQVLAALLAIMGYSLNDTIIVYDRIRENMAVHTKFDLPDVLNRSVNQTLSRTVLTSGTTLAAVLVLLVLGGEVIRPFALAMSIGIVVGTYSSIFIAAPTLLLLERVGESDRQGGTRSDRAAASEGSESGSQPRKRRGQAGTRAGRRAQRGKR